MSRSNVTLTSIVEMTAYAWMAFAIRPVEMVPIAKVPNGALKGHAPSLKCATLNSIASETASAAKTSDALIPVTESTARDNSYAMPLPAPVEKRVPAPPMMAVSMDVYAQRAVRVLMRVS